MASTAPVFPACINPQGTVKAHYAQGTHGIVGNSGTYTGSDTVYQITDKTVMQCFCAENGEGIQTNWFEVSNLSESDIKNLIVQGWILVPNGALWGLNNASYLAQNSTYSCKGSSNGTGGSSSSNTGGQAILSQATTNVGAVLGLANTGTLGTVYSLISAGSVAVILGLLLNKKKE